MKRKDLEIALEKVLPFDSPDASLEQYPTPSAIASDILFAAYANGDIQDREVVDLGCGTGIFSIGASLLGASSVKGYDISQSAIDIAERNAETLGADVGFILSDVRDVREKADTVMMNPPFGSQRRHADRPFLEKAMDISDSIYSIHMANTLPFLKEFVEEHGREITACATYKYNIPHTFTFHSKTKKEVDIIVVNVR